MHPRHKLILYPTLLYKLSTIEKKFGIHVPKTCVYSGITDETRDPLLFECNLTKNLLLRLLKCLGM